MSKPTASIVIPTYNGRSYLSECLASLKAQTWQGTRVIVVDNASADGTAEFLKSDYPSVELIRLETNTGFAGGCNIGAKAAQGDWIVFLNNDTVVEPDWLENLLTTAASDEKMGACTSKIRMLSDRQRLDAIGSYLTPSGFLRHTGLLENDQGQYDSLRQIFSPKGVSFAIRKELFNAIGGFDERYFAYFEESDLFWQVWLRGYTIGFAPKSIVYHKVGGTASTFHYAFVDYHSFKNRIRTILKNAGTITLFWMLPLHLVCCAGLAVVNLFKISRWKNAGSIVRAIGWNILVLPDTLKARRKVQSSRKISDRDLFEHALRPIPLKEFAQYVFWMVFSREKMRTEMQKVVSPCSS